MYRRMLAIPKNKSFFLFGARGTGKTTWLKRQLSDSVYIDLLDAEVFTELLAHPTRLAHFVPAGSKKKWIVIDEVQKLPELLDEVHRLIENECLRFVLTGSSARKLKQSGTNLLAGRALTKFMYPLLCSELGSDYSLEHALEYGFLPSTYTEADPKSYLSSYVQTFLKEEVQQEGLTRNLGAFSRFLESASFSQAQVLNMSAVGRDCSLRRKVVEGYFTILEDLLLADRLPVFARRAKRQMVAHPKFMFFDAGVFRTLRPRGPLDGASEIDGAALETVVFQQLKAINAYQDLGYRLYYWRTKTNLEVDLVLYGERGLKAFEIKRSDRYSNEDLKGLRAFKQDYPAADTYFLYCGSREFDENGIQVLPLAETLPLIREYL